MTAASSSMSQSSASPSRGAKAAPANFFVHDAIAKTKQEGEPLMKAPPATQDRWVLCEGHWEIFLEKVRCDQWCVAFLTLARSHTALAQEVPRVATREALQI